MRLTQFPSALANRPLRHRRNWRHIGHLALLTAAGLVAVLVVALGIVVGIVLSGPTEIGVLRDHIQTGLQRALGDTYAVSVGRAVIDVDPVLGLVVEVDNIEVRDSEQSVVARAPATRLAVDPLALLRLKISVSVLEASGTELSLVRSDDGQVYLGNSQTAHAAARKRAQPTPKAVAGGPDGGFPDLFEALQILDRGLEPQINAAVAAGFARFNLIGGAIDIWDAERLQQRRFPNTDINISVDPASGNLTAGFATSGYAGRWTANFERDIDAATGTRYLSGVFSQLALADLFPGLGAKASLFDADIPLYGRASLAFAADGAVLDASVRLDVGAGVFRFGENHETVILDEATVKVRWDVANKVVVIDPSPFFFGDTRGVVTGSIRPEGDPKARRYIFTFESNGAILAPRDSNEKPLVAERIGLSGVADLAGKLVTIDEFAVSTSNGSVAAAGSLGFEGSTPSLALAASFSPMPAATLKQIWVPFIAPGARRWVMEHIIDGKILSGRIEAAIPAGILWNPERPAIPEDGLKLDARLEDVSFTTFGELPPIVNASGNLVLVGSTFGVDIEKANVVTPSGASVSVDAGAFAIDNVFKRGAEGVIEVQLSGGAAALGEIADARPLLVLDRRKVAPSDLSGTADASVSVRLPLVPRITEADVDWKVTIIGTDLASKAPIEGRTVSKANVTIGVTPDEVTVNGKADIDGVPADVALSQPITIGGLSAGPGQQVARLTLDQAARTRLGIGLDDILGGTVGALVSSIGEGQTGQHYELDLKQARLTIPGVGWSKGIGVPAMLYFDLKPVKDGYSVDNLVLQGSGFGFSGTAMLDADHSLVSADIGYFSLRPGDSIALKLTATKAGYAITARGETFDMRGVITELKGDSSSGGGADITVEAEVGSLSGFNGQAITNAKIAYASSAGTTRKATLTGQLGGAPVSFAYTNQPDRGTLTASAGDAGSVFRFLDVYSRVGGGTLSVDAARQGKSDPLAGTFEVDGFDILDEPAAQKIISSAPGGRGATEVNPARLHFDRMVARFRMTDQAITIDDALIKGAAIGATFNGRLDLIRSYLTINGTYIPAYAFNNAFSRVPLIGLVLGGGNREGGLIGVTFRVEGPISGPRLFFNPLSAVAPGIFRKIFEFR